MAEVKCDGTNWGPCSGPVTHLDKKGFAYCETHGLYRRESGIACRRLRPWELRRLLRGEALNRY